MKKELIFFILLSSLLIPSLVSANISGVIEGITSDIDERPYYISETPRIGGIVRNNGNENYNAYVVIEVTAPDGTIYRYRSVTFSPEINTSYWFPIYFEELSSEGVGLYEVQVEFWRDRLFDELLDYDSSYFEVIFNPPENNREYLVDDYWHHPSSPTIRIWGVYAVGGGATTPSRAADNLQGWVNDYIEYTQEELCDGDNSPCGDRSNDLWILHDEMGDCNDFADLYTSFARAVNIPTGYTVGYKFEINPDDPSWEFPDYGSQELYEPRENDYWGHAWAESFINQWIPVDPTWNEYNNPSVYDGGEGAHLIVRRQSNYEGNGDYLDLENLERWEDVTRVRPHDNTWEDASLSLYTGSPAEPIFVDNTIEILTEISHSGDMTARNTILTASGTEGLTMISGSEEESLGNIEWIDDPINREWQFRATSNGEQQITLIVDSDDTEQVTDTISYNIYEPPTISNIHVVISNEVELQDGQFYLNLILSNNGDITADCVSATINLPEGLILTENNQTQTTTISANNQTEFSWGITPNAIGDYNNQITILVEMDEECIGNYGYGYSNIVETGLRVVDTIPPVVSIKSPVNQVYETGTINLEYTVDETAVWCGYSLNNGDYITIIGNTLIEDLTQQNYNLVLICRDENENEGSDSVTFTIDWNDLPVVDSATITPTPAYTTDNLTCENGATHDEDGDEITLSYEWYKNDELQEILTTQTISSENTLRGESWKCVITPNDGEIDGNKVESNSIIIANSLPVLNSIENIEVGESDLVTISPIATDVDEDEFSFSFSEPLNESGEWQTTFDDAGTYIITVTVNDGNEGTDSQEVIITVHNDLDEDGIPDYEDSDDDNDGINDSEDNVVGNINNVVTNIEDLTLTIGNSTNMTQIFNGTQTVNFMESDEVLVSFNFNFDISILNLDEITIQKQTDNDFGSILIEGITLSDDNTKTVYVDNLNDEINSTCIKDAEIASINEISDNCNGDNEFLITCNDVLDRGYICTDLGSKYEVTGLTHSGVKEQNPFCGDGVCNNGEDCSGCSSDCGACPSIPKSGRGGGGGGGGFAPLITTQTAQTNQTICEENWICADWDKCLNNAQTRFCLELNKCNTTKNKPDEIKQCEGAVLNKSEENQTSPKGGGLFGITGAVIGADKTASTLIIIAILVVVGIWIGSYFWFKKKKKYKK